MNIFYLNYNTMINIYIWFGYILDILNRIGNIEDDNLNPLQGSPQHRSTE